MNRTIRNEVRRPRRPWGEERSHGAGAWSLQALAVLILGLSMLGCQASGKRVIAKFGLPDPHPSRVLMQLNPGFDIADLLNQIDGAGAGGSFSVEYDLNGLAAGLYVLEAEEDEWAGNVGGAALFIDALPSARFAETDPVTVLADTPKAKLYSHQWGLVKGTPSVAGVSIGAGGDVRAEAAWDITKGDPSIPVAVLDNGVFADHPDLSGAISAIIDVLQDEAVDSADRVLAAHGTRTSGLIAARGFSPGGAPGIAGVCPEGAVVMVRVLNEDHGYVSDALQGLNLVVEQGIRVSSNSWLTRTHSQALLAAIAGAGEKGHLFVTVAGNDGLALQIDGVALSKWRAFPAAYGDVLESLVVVAAGAPNDQLASFSNYDQLAVHLSAPGAYVLSPMPPKDWSYAHGTSYAAPLVAGAVALALAAEDADGDARRSKDVTPASMKQALIASARHLSALEERVQSEGMLDIAALVQLFADN